MAVRTLALRQSKNVKDAQYDADAQTLTVKLNGGTYTVDGVTEEKAIAFEQADSHGSFFHSEFKGQHVITKVN